MKNNSIAVIITNEEIIMVKTPETFSGIFNFLEDRKNNIIDEIICYNYDIDVLSIKEIIWFVDGLVITGSNKDNVKIFGQQTKEAKEILNKYKDIPVEEVETWEYPRGL